MNRNSLFSSILTLLTFELFSPCNSLTLDQAIDLAVKNNDKIYQYNERISQKACEERAARGNYLPSVTLSVNYNYLNDPFTMDLNEIRTALITLEAKDQAQILGGSQLTQTNPVYQSIYKKAYSALDASLPQFIDTLKKQRYPEGALTVVQPLFTGGKIYAGVKAAKAEKRAAEIEFENTRNDLIRETSNSYLSAALAQAAVIVRKDALDAIILHQSKAEKMAAQGLIAKYHLLRAEVAVSEARRNLSDAESLSKIAMLVLRKCLNVPDSVQIVISDSLQFTPITDSLNHFLETASKEQPALKLIEEKRNLAQAKLRAQYSVMVPQIAAFGKYELFPDYLSALEPAWIVGVTASVPLFNGFKNISGIQSAKHLINEVDKIEIGMRHDIDLLVKKSYIEMKNAEEKYNQLNSDLQLAEENLRQCRSRFESGYGTSLEIIDAQLVLEKNRIDRLSAIHEYYKDYIDLLTATGHPERIVNCFERKGNSQ